MKLSNLPIKYSQFFNDEIPMDWMRPPLLAKISKNPQFFYDNTLLE